MILEVIFIYIQELKSRNIFKVMISTMLAYQSRVVLPRSNRGLERKHLNFHLERMWFLNILKVFFCCLLQKNHLEVGCFDCFFEVSQ